MIAQPGHEKPASKARLPRCDQTVEHGSRSTNRTDFDVHHWLQQYLASHEGANPSDPLAGVPFN